MSKGDKITAAGLIGFMLIASGADTIRLPTLLIALTVCCGVIEIGRRMAHADEQDTGQDKIIYKPIIGDKERICNEEI